MTPNKSWPYTSDCNYQKKIDDTGWIGARTALPALYAAEAVCKALNNELPGAMDAAGIKATFKLRKVNPDSARPLTLKEDAAAIGAKYVVALGEPYGFGGYQQYGPSVSIKVRLYDAVSGEYRGYAEDTYPISLRDYSNRGRPQTACGSRRIWRKCWRARCASAASRPILINAARQACSAWPSLAMPMASEHRVCPG